jgi:hypothetical protein
MARPAHARRLLAAALGLGLCSPCMACGRPAANDAEGKTRRIDDPAELEELDQSNRAKLEEQAKRAPPPKWKRSAPPMPESFVAFELPELAALDGVWLVESEIPGQRALWLIEEAGVKLTEIDEHGRERIYGITLASPCALRLTDEHGRARTRVLALDDERLFISREGATAVRGKDGSMLACAGHRTYQLAADGRCRYTTEMLGSWTEPAKPEKVCKLAKDGALTIGDQLLREHEGLWLDELALAARATRLSDREAGLAALTAEPGAESESAKPSEPGASGAGSESAGQEAEPAG